MYQPAHFRPSDRGAVTALMHEQPLATLVTLQGGALTADHVPLLYDAESGEHGTLRGHVARANPVWQHAHDHDVMAVFHGVQAYVSPSWYPTKASTHKVVPTWNYAVVHAHGRLRVVDDAAWLHALVSRLTELHETGRASPWAVSDAPSDFIDQMLRAIVGVEIVVSRLDAKFKLSQNRSEPDRLGTAEGLAAEPSPGARAMAPLLRRD